MTNTDSIQSDGALPEMKFVPGAFGYNHDNTQFDFLVNPAIDPSLANSQAWALEGAVKDMLRKSVGDGSLMDVNLCFLCAHALDTAAALRNVSGSND